MNKRMAAIEKELAAIARQEQTLEKAAKRNGTPNWNRALEQKLPEKVEQSLKIAFCKAFSVVFERGTGIIERTYSREKLEQEHKIQDYAFQVREDRRSLKDIRRGTAAADLRNLAFTTVGGVGLGALGIGLPDIVVFVGMLLKGVYETALHYGFSYDTPEEQLLILKLLRAPVLRQEPWQEANREIDRLLEGEALPVPTPEERKEQLNGTAEAFAMDMLLLKFVQGLPVVGVLGGAGNPVYYHRVMKYVRLKYQKRYLLAQKKQ